MRMLIISWRLLSVFIPVMLSGPADPEIDADADAVPDHPNIRSDGSLHRDRESGVCVWVELALLRPSLPRPLSFAGVVLWMRWMSSLPLVLILLVSFLW